MEKIDLLLAIARSGGMYSDIMLTTGKLAKDLGVSQQTVSNSLKTLEAEGLLEREASPAGIRLCLTDVGRAKLSAYHQQIGSLLSGSAELTGKVFSGIGEGKYYIGLEGYKKQFGQKLGMIAYPGTLNLRVEQEERKRFLESSKAKVVDIAGFSTKERTYGEIAAYPVFIGGIKAAILVPKRTHYKADVVELISEHDLRKKLKLKDDDKVKITWEII